MEEKDKVGKRRGAEDQQETKIEQQVSRVLGSRKPSIEQYLGGKAGCPVDPVLVLRVVPAHVLAELDSMAFKE